MQYKFTLIFLIISITQSYSQQQSNRMIQQGSEVLIDRLQENNFYYTHIIQKGQTVYSLARTFRTSVSKIYSMNNINAKSAISIGQTIKVPFDVNTLYTEESTKNPSSNKFVPVYYIAQAKETLYGIGKTYFGQDVAMFSKRNKINGTSISIGQKLLIGWLPINGDGIAVRVNTTIVKTDKVPNPENKYAKLERTHKKDVIKNDDAQLTASNQPIKGVIDTESIRVEDTVEKRVVERAVKVKNIRRAKFITTIVTPQSIIANHNKISVPNPSEIRVEIASASEELSDTLTTKLEEPIIKKAPSTRTRHTRGIGIWERDSKVGQMAFVLHHTAKKGSTIELYNPQLKLRTRAKVLGRIPMGTYPSDVSVIMSRKVANSLGALDTRFMVELNFVEEIK